jgi:hypothetical protein
LLAEYAARRGRPTSAATEQVFTIAAAPDRRRCGSAAADMRAMPTTLTSSTRSHSWSSLSATVPWAPMPALFTSTSIPPRSRTMRSMTEATAALSVTSHS